MQVEKYKCLYLYINAYIEHEHDNEGNVLDRKARIKIKHKQEHVWSQPARHNLWSVQRDQMSVCIIPALENKYHKQDPIKAQIIR